MRTVSLSDSFAMCCSFSEASMALNASISAGSATGSFDVVQQPAEVLQRVGNTLQELALRS